jgi:hypothetical protein
MIGAIIAKRTVRSAFASLNRRDIPAFLSSWARLVSEFFAAVSPDQVHDKKHLY